MFELRGVAKGFDGVAALGPLDLSIAPGRTTVLIGPSGCGKSTLLKLLCGLVWPDRGEVRFDGARLTPQDAPTLRRRIGYVIQEGGLFPHLTARRNVELMARYLRMEPARRADRIRDLGTLARLPPEALDRFPAQLSGGQRQRVSLMRALMLDPDVLLFDEPLGALDPMVRSDLQADLRAAFRSLRKTVVLVTHDLAEAAWFADTVVLVRSGQVVQQGPIQSLFESPAEPFVTQFVNAQRSVLPSSGGPA